MKTKLMIISVLTAACIFVFSGATWAESKKERRNKNPKQKHYTVAKHHKPVPSAKPVEAMQADTRIKNIGIISGLTSGANITTRAATTVIIGISRITDTCTNTVGIISRTIKSIGRLKNTTATGIIARFTATPTVTCRSWHRHLAEAGQLKYHPGISGLFSEGGAVELSRGILRYFSR